jgi:hypothetical protein
MRTVKYFVLAVLSVAAVGVFSASGIADKKDVLEIEAIMDKAHKPPAEGEPSLAKLVVTGKASKDQKEELLKLYMDLGKNKPPKGDAADWKRRCDAIVAAAKGVVANRPGAGGALAKAINCKACHDLHKGE